MIWEKAQVLESFSLGSILLSWFIYVSVGFAVILFAHGLCLALFS